MIRHLICTQLSFKILQMNFLSMKKWTKMSETAIMSWKINWYMSQSFSYRVCEHFSMIREMVSFSRVLSFPSHSLGIKSTKEGQIITTWKPFQIQFSRNQILLLLVRAVFMYIVIVVRFSWFEVCSRSVIDIGKGWDGVRWDEYCDWQEKTGMMSRKRKWVD